MAWHAYGRDRFHVTVKASLDAGAKEVVELRQPMTERMKQIQGAIIECLDACLGELRRSHTSLDVEQLTVENALLKSFDIIVRRQLDPVWHQISQRTKRLVHDMQTLRQLLVYLISYDCVAFNAYLDTLVASQSSSTSIGGYSQPPSLWMMMDAANVLFNTARERVYRRQGATGRRLPASGEGIPPDVELVLEEQPKWALLRDTLREIDGDVHHQGPTLVLVQDTRTAHQLERYWVKEKAATVGNAARSMLYTAATEYFQWKQQFTRITTTATTTTGSGASTATSSREGRQVSRSSGGQRQPPAGKRRRIRGGSATAARAADRGTVASPASMESGGSGQEASNHEEHDDAASARDNSNSPAIVDVPSTSKQARDDEASGADVEDKTISLLDGARLLVIRPISGNADDQLLEDLQPSHIIIYDPNPMLVRQVEMYQAQHADQLARVYFMLYADSVEEQRYLSDIRREKAAFERLIHENSVVSAYRVLAALSAGLFDAIRDPAGDVQ
ncbi:hypothetical protein SYNPS1DRAFT_30917 [Syncephalis pseudoplumigaleata]|uniref:ERCC4 domain-containing protein n=1 Tax=Syncephalis pseudoplumigaleata TaxID=1712513 RepID=A0A4P9YU72_9FUNG|nr:hypothetical protein SYNPS1DRAFT_30917 [Syncephalis pseudoplumigaleata]|eukprot:RKP23345.1 hypothetical protein SYNPS1DRAFT_30917 [Syncephalis pseudoplumigaleata]